MLGERGLEHVYRAPAGGALDRFLMAPPRVPAARSVATMNAAAAGLRERRRRRFGGATSRNSGGGTAPCRAVGFEL